MSDFFDSLRRQGGRLAAAIRPRHLAMAAGVLVLGVGLAGAGALARPKPAAASDDARLSIQVVAPVEAEITPGTVMDVGPLVDGFVYVPPPPPPRAERYEAWDDGSGPYEPAPPSPRARRYVEEAVIQPPPQPRPPMDDRREGRVSRWLGFDAPDRDYRAEREARRARDEMRAERERDRALDRERDRRDPRREYRDDRPW